MVLTIHHLSVSQSDRLIWLCEELNLPYNLEVHKRDPLLAPAVFKTLHPMGVAPVIHDTAGDTTLAESNACAEYILQVHGGGRLAVQPGAPGYVDYLYWFQFANGTLQPAVSRAMILRLAGLDASNAMVAAAETRLRAVLAFMDARLKTTGAWLAGREFSAADVMAVTSVTTMRSFCPFGLEGLEGVLGWLGRVKGRAAYREAMRKGDPELDLEVLCGEGKPPVFEAMRGMLREG